MDRSTRLVWVCETRVGPNLFCVSIRNRQDARAPRACGAAANGEADVWVARVCVVVLQSLFFGAPRKTRGEGSENGRGTRAHGHAVRHRARRLRAGYTGASVGVARCVWRAQHTRTHRLSIPSRARLYASSHPTTLLPPGCAPPPVFDRAQRDGAPAAGVAGGALVRHGCHHHDQRPLHGRLDHVGDGGAVGEECVDGEGLCVRQGAF